MIADSNYVLGKGELSFAAFADQKRKVLSPDAGYRFLGNVPTFSLSGTADKLEHYRSTGGIGELDADPTTKVTRTASITLEDITGQNMALNLLGQTVMLTQAKQDSVKQVFNSVVPGLTYQLGISTGNPFGVGCINSLVLTVGSDGTGAALAPTVDYVYDFDHGTFTILSTSTLITSDTPQAITAVWSSDAYKIQQTISGSESVSGSVRFKSIPAYGDPLHYWLPYVTFTPNGETQLIGDTFMQIPLTVGVKKLGQLEAVYCNGDPVKLP